MPDIIIDIVGTEEYFNKHSFSHMEDVEDYCQDWWDIYVENNGSHEAVFISQNELSYSIPESALEGSSGTSNRRQKANDYNQDNFEWWHNTHVILVLDDSSEHDGLGSAIISSAGTNNKTCMVHVGGSYSGYLRETQEFGTSLHEVLHTVNVRHVEGALFSDETSSIIATEDDDRECLEQTNTIDKRVDFISSCSRSVVRTYIDNNL